jgi:hypothetical protein
MTALAIEATTQIELSEVAPNLKLTFMNEPLPYQAVVMQSKNPIFSLSVVPLYSFAIVSFDKYSISHK